MLTEAGLGPLPELPPATNAVAPAGTALIFEGRCIHGTGVNHTDDPRRVLLLTLHKPFMRTQDNFDVVLKKDIYEQASPKLLERLGFAVTPISGTLGGVEGNLEVPSAAGIIAPLRDDYIPVGELGPGSTDEELTREYSFRSTVTGIANAKRLAQMKAGNESLVRNDAPVASKL